YRGLTGLRPIVLDDASGSPVDPDSTRAPSASLRPRGRVTARVSILASSLAARWYGRQSRTAACESPAPLPTSTRQAGREGNPARSRDRQPPARQVWPLARQFSRDVWCVPRRSRLEGQAPLAHDDVPLSRSQAANRRGGCTPQRQQRPRRWKSVRREERNHGADGWQHRQAARILENARRQRSAADTAHGPAVPTYRY